MLYPLSRLGLLVDWDNNGGPIYPSLLRSKPLLEKLKNHKLLVLYGPPNAGKRTFALYLIKKWSEEYNNKGQISNVLYFDLAERRNLADEHELTVDEFHKNNSSSTPTLYVFAHCGHLLNALDTLLRKCGPLNNAYVLITVSCSAEILQKYSYFNSALEQQQVELWNADVALVKEILDSAKRDSEHLKDNFNTVFNDAATGSANLKFVRNYIESSPNLTLTQWIRSAGKFSESDPMAFFSGGPASDADIADGLDVLRTQYVEDWIDEKGNSRKSLKKLLLEQNDEALSKKKPRLIIIYGHKGSGKSTLCKRMLHDLLKNSILAIDILHEPLNSNHIKAILEQAHITSNRRVHVFTELEDINDAMLIQEFLAALKKLAGARNLSIYVTVDTNKWKQIELKIMSSAKNFGYEHEDRRLRGQLDEREMNGLIAQLKKHQCLFRLKHKTDAAIHLLFRKKARKSLLACLIEATRCTDESEDLAAILWREYEELTQNAQWAYSIVLFFTAFGINVPYAVFEKALTKLTGNPGYFGSLAFHNETAEIIWQPRTKSYRLRQPLIAITMLDRFHGPKWDDFKYKIVEAWFGSLDLSNHEQRCFFELSLDRKVLLNVVTDLSPLIDQLQNGTFTSFQPKELAQILNSIIRIYQGRHNYREGKLLSEKSLTYWNHIGNQANYLKGFCSYHIGETEEAKRVASYLVTEMEWPYHFLHGVELLCALREWRTADNALKEFEKRWGADVSLTTTYLKLRNDVNSSLAVTSVQWSDAGMDALKPTAALERIEWDIDAGYDREKIVEQYRRLLRRQHDFFQGYISFFTYLHNPRGDFAHEASSEKEQDAKERFQILKAECEYHLAQQKDYRKKYPDNILSILISNLARAIFKLDYIAKNGYPEQNICEPFFKKAILLKSDNWYAHNWYATFFKEVHKNFTDADIHYKKAVKGDDRNPVFKYNLALLYYNWPTFSRHHMEQASKLAKDSIFLCNNSVQWKNFVVYPEELLLKIEILLKRTDITDGDVLDADELLQPDVEQ